jgi:queuine tRNA-ribosyltransferase catalytic subunit
VEKRSRPFAECTDCVILSELSVSLCTDLLPRDKPIYLMGVVIGNSKALLISGVRGGSLGLGSSRSGHVRLRISHPNRCTILMSGSEKQRFGHAITPKGVLNLRNREYADDFGPIDPTCQCPCCRPGGWGVTRSLIYHLACKETGIPSLCLVNDSAGAHFLTMHNVQYQLNLMSQARRAIKEDRYPDFLREFFSTLYDGNKERYPKWAVDALRTVNVDLMQDRGIDQAMMGNSYVDGALRAGAV